MKERGYWNGRRGGKGGLFLSLGLRPSVPPTYYFVFTIRSFPARRSFSSISSLSSPSLSLQRKKKNIFKTHFFGRPRCPPVETRRRRRGGKILPRACVSPSSSSRFCLLSLQFWSRRQKGKKGTRGAVMCMLLYMHTYTTVETLIYRQEHCHDYHCQFQSSTSTGKYCSSTVDIYMFIYATQFALRRLGQDGVNRSILSFNTFCNQLV